MATIRRTRSLPDLSALGITLPSSDGAYAVVGDYEGVTMDNFVDGKTNVFNAATGNSQTVDFATQ